MSVSGSHRHGGKLRIHDGFRVGRWVPARMPVFTWLPGRELAETEAACSVFSDEQARTEARAKARAARAKALNFRPRSVRRLTALQL